MALLDALILFAVVWIGLSVAWLVRERRRALAAARWEPRTRAVQGGGHIVELVCRGEPAGGRSPRGGCPRRRRAPRRSTGRGRPPRLRRHLAAVLGKGRRRPRAE